MLFRELVAMFCAWCTLNRAPRTAEFYQGQYARLLPKLGDLPAADLRPVHLVEWRETWHLILAIQRLYGWAVNEKKILAENPMATLKRPRLRQRRRVLAGVELSRILRGSAGAFRRFLLAARESAARPQELREVSWEQLRWPGKYGELRRALESGEAFFLLEEFKGRERRADQTEDRIIPVSPRLGRLLWRLCKGRPLTGLVFKTDNGGTWNRNSLRLRMRRLRERVDVAPKVHGEKVVCYTLRHSAATGMASEGLQTSVLQQLLGHASLKTTQRYVHLNQKQLLHSWQEFHARKAPK